MSHGKINTIFVLEQHFFFLNFLKDSVRITFQFMCVPSEFHNIFSVGSSNTLIVLLQCATSNPDGRKRALVVGGGIANFTDVAATFNGIIRAMKEKVSLS